jgi:RNA-binding protein
VVRIGQQGLTEAVVAKADQELEAHELIKVKIGDNCMDDVKQLVGLLAEQTQSENVQVIGRVGVLYRRRRKDPEIVLPPSRPSQQ